MKFIHSGLVIYGKDFHRVAQFYAAVLGLEETHRDDEYAMLKASHFQLVILQLPSSLMEVIEVTTPPKKRNNTAIKPVFFIDDIATARELIKKHGGELNPPSKEWNFEGTTVCDGIDCEGNVFQLRAAIDEKQ